MGIESFPMLAEVPNDTVLLVCKMRGKRAVDLIPRAREFMNRWYSDFIAYETTEITDPPLGRFLSSLYVRGSEESENALDKFLFYLLRGEVNGEILEELINLKVEESMKKTKPLPMLRARYFFSRL
jgi:hypothetical protein